MNRKHLKLLVAFALILVALLSLSFFYLNNKIEDRADETQALVEHISKLKLNLVCGEYEQVLVPGYELTCKHQEYAWETGEYKEITYVVDSAVKSCGFDDTVDFKVKEVYIDGECLWYKIVPPFADEIIMTWPDILMKTI